MSNAIEDAIRASGQQHSHRNHRIEPRRLEDVKSLEQQYELLQLVLHFRRSSALNAPNTDGDYWKDEIDRVLNKFKIK